MKDSEFIELLNLYLDHEISGADAARLEAEVQDQPSRRRLYQDYCRMQKACKLLAEDFATPASASERKVVPFDRAAAGTHRRFGWAGAASLAAAAAFVAAVFVHRSHQVVPGAPAGNAVAEATPTAAAKPQTTPTVAAPVPVQMVAEHQPAQVNDALSLRHVPEQNDALALANQMPADPHFSWIQDVHLRPLQMPAAAGQSTDQLQFELTPNLQPQNRTYSSGKQPPAADVPWIAIRFQR